MNREGLYSWRAFSLRNTPLAQQLFGTQFWSGYPALVFWFSHLLEKRFEQVEWASILRGMGNFPNVLGLEHSSGAKTETFKLFPFATSQK